MEPLGAFPDGEWDSISRMFFIEEGDHFAEQYTFPNEHDDNQLSFGTSSTFWPSHESIESMGRIDHESLFYSSNTPDSNLFQFCQQTSYSSSPPRCSVFYPNATPENLYFSDSNHFPVISINNSEFMEDFCMINEKQNGSSGPVFHDQVMDEEKRLDGGHGKAVAIPDKEVQPKRKLSEMPQLRGADATKNTDMPENPKKKCRVSKEVKKSRKNVQAKKKGKDEEETNAGQNGQSSSTYSSEDDSNASQELNEGTISDSKGPIALNLNGRTRANRGSATDPQSLYARKRRERINERLKILQGLVPNGTKVDISTMLEEAVQYVKFLQLQIKLLSSDDMWMYAPLAYNGMDIGLLQKNSLPL